VGASTASPALHSLSLPLGPLAAASKPANRPALLSDRGSPVERETIAARPLLPPPPQGPDALSAARKTSASDAMFGGAVTRVATRDTGADEQCPTNAGPYVDV